MQFKFAHLRQPSKAGEPLDFAIFGARSPTGLDPDNQVLLDQLTTRARAKGLKVDRSALAYTSDGQLRFFGSAEVVEYLSASGLPPWTHYMEA